MSVPYPLPLEAVLLKIEKAIVLRDQQIPERWIGILTRDPGGEEPGGPLSSWLDITGEQEQYGFGVVEASRIPPEWHGWIHHIVDVPPTAEAYTAREWEKPHLPNLTGTPEAYRPAGSILASGQRPKATGDYQPWTPG